MNLCKCGCGEETNTELALYKPGHHKRKLDFIVDSNDCWIWQKRIGHHGYGYQWDSIKDTMIHAHRFYYEKYKGKITKGLVIDHLCRVRTCVNPEHLEMVTHKVNILRGEGIAAKKSKQTHCIHGHELKEPNLYYTKRGNRQCRQCAIYPAKRKNK